MYNTIVLHLESHLEYKPIILLPILLFRVSIHFRNKYYNNYYAKVSMSDMKR